MFYGSYVHNLDNKGRLVIPAKMRDEFGCKAYILKGFDGCLSIFKEDGFQKLMDRIQSLSFNKKVSRAFIREQLSSVCELEIDKQGRAQLPAQLLSKYKIGKEVIIVGVVDHIEVWNTKDFEAYEQNANSSFEDYAEELDEKED